MARVLRDEVVSLLRETQTTAIIVTHDQEEALSVCDIVSVLENGNVIQSATPQEIYLKPNQSICSKFSWGSKYS
jgi:ABC-type sulfate/molybdate transport systems ATPase subunit